MWADQLKHSLLPENGSLLRIHFVPPSYLDDQGEDVSSRHLVPAFLPERNVVFKLVLIKCRQIKVMRVLAPHVRSKTK